MGADGEGFQYTGRQLREKRRLARLAAEGSKAASPREDESRAGTRDDAGLWIRGIGSFLAASLGGAIYFISAAPWRLLSLMGVALGRLVATPRRAVVRIASVSRWWTKIRRARWSRREVMIVIAVMASLLFVYFIWPTPYSYHAVGGRLVRVNRVTGAAHYVPIEWP